MCSGHLQKVRKLFKKSDHPSLQVGHECLESFSSLVASKCGLGLFREFLQQEYSHENLDFWLAVEKLKKCEPHELANEVNVIYDNFLASNAPNEVNFLDDDIRSAILIKIQSNNLDDKVFNQAQRRVQNVIENDSYIRFLNRWNSTADNLLHVNAQNYP